MKTLTIKCDGINSISTQYYSGEIEIELKNPDYQFIQNLEADLLLRNGLDWETFVKEIDKDDLCEFLTGDINEAVAAEKNYDIVIFGAAGNVLGNPEETMRKLSRTVKNGGFLLID